MQKIIHKLLIARNVARQNNEDASDVARTQYDLKAAPHKFLPQQLVLLDEHSFLHKNQKLAPKWSGPHKIIRLKGDANVEIQLRLQDQKTPQVPLEPEAMTFSRSFDVWPLHRMQILPDGSTRYWLTRDEKEQLKFLGLKNLFITADSADAKRLRKNAVEKIRRK